MPQNKLPNYNNKQKHEEKKKNHLIEGRSSTTEVLENYSEILFASLQRWYQAQIRIYYQVQTVSHVM